MKNLLFIILTICFLSACAGSPPTGSYKFRPEIQVGEITGSQEFAAELAKRDNNKGAFILQGQAQIAFSEKSGEEKVYFMKSGAKKEILAPDVFTGQLWTVNEPEKIPATESFPLKSMAGKLFFHWQLFDETGQKIKSGSLQADYHQLFEGFVLKNKKNSTASQNEKDARQYLSKTLADKLVMTLGREPGALEIESNEKQTSEAKRQISLGNWEEAKNIWLSLLEQNPGYYPALFNLGLYYEREANLHEAYAYYKKAFLAGGYNKAREALSRIVNGLSGKVFNAETF